MRYSRLSRFMCAQNSENLKYVSFPPISRCLWAKFSVYQMQILEVVFFNGFGIDLCLFFGVKNFYGLEIFLIFSSTEEEWDFRASN